MDQRVYRMRRANVQRLLRKKGIRHYLVTSLTNVRYLCGFSGSNAAVLITPESPVFISDARYKEQSHAEVAGCRIVIVEEGPFVAGVGRTIEDSRSRRIGFEPQSMSVMFHKRLRRQLQGRARLHPYEGVVESLRVVKDDREVRSLRRASRIADRAFRRLLDELPVGITEREAQWRLLNILRDLGSERSPFEPIVLFGARASLPHGQPGNAKLATGDWVLMDYGAVADGYCSDFTRTVVKGRATEEMRTRHTIVRKGQQAAVRAARPRMSARKVDAAARTVIEKAGYGKEFSHGLGHGVGLEVHEEPRLGQRSQTRLRAGMVITIEPGIYIPGWGGIRIEDTVLITPNGFSRLTRASHALIEV